MALSVNKNTSIDLFYRLVLVRLLRSISTHTGCVSKINEVKIKMAAQQTKQHLRL